MIIDQDETEFYNNLDPDLPKCKLLKRRDFYYQYSYYLEFDDKTNHAIFSIYLTESQNFNVSYSGAIGIYLRKLLVLHFPNADVGSLIKIYLPNYVSPITKLVKAHFRLDCTQDMVLSLKDDYRIELL